MNFRVKRYHLVWLFHHGRWPELEIDHIDRNKINDRIENLREATRQENAANINKGNKLPTGVSWFKQNKKYQAYMYRKGRKVHLGYFDVPEDAAERRRIAMENEHAD